jgi:hypothetical protein
MTQTAELPARRTVPEHVRRLSRYKFALLRVQQIAGGSPRLTDGELEELAAVLLAARSSAEDSAA